MTTTTTDAQTTGLRRCIGSSRSGIEAHDADPGDFPVQPSQKDGLGRMCKPHWRQYTNALRKAAVARRAAEEAISVPAPEREPEVVEAPGEDPEPETPAPRKTRRATATAGSTDEVDIA